MGVRGVQRTATSSDVHNVEERHLSRRGVYGGQKIAVPVSAQDTYVHTYRSNNWEKECTVEKEQQLML